MFLSGDVHRQKTLVKRSQKTKRVFSASLNQFAPADPKYLDKARGSGATRNKLNNLAIYTVCIYCYLLVYRLPNCLQTLVLWRPTSTHTHAHTADICMSDSCIDIEENCLSHLSVWWAPMESFSWRHKTFSPLALSAGVHLYLGSGLHLANWGLNDSHNYTIFSHITLYRKLIKDSTKLNHLKSDIVPQSIPYLKRTSARFICKLSDC